MLNVVAYEIVKRRRPSSSFDFSGASIGNLFLTGYVLTLMKFVHDAQLNMRFVLRAVSDAKQNDAFKHHHMDI